MIEYRIEETLPVEEFREILVNSTLGERRPVDDHATLSKMIEHANLIVTARENGLLVGVARSLTDFDYCTYLSDLAVHRDHQRTGIGKELIRRTKEAAPKARLILLSAPKAVEYYPRIGMTQWPQCYVLDRVEDLK